MKIEKLNQILRELNSSSPDIEASAMMTIDGLTIATVLSEGINEDIVGAMGAALLEIGGRTATELKRGPLEQVMVKGGKGYVVITGAGPEVVLAVVARETAKLGLIFLEVRRAADVIAATMR